MGKQWYANAGALVRYVHPDHTPAPVPAFVRQQTQRVKGAAQERMSHADVWFGLEDMARAELVTLCTDRPTEGAHRVRWEHLTDTERASIAGFVKRMARAAQAGKGLW